MKPVPRKHHGYDAVIVQPGGWCAAAILSRSQGGYGFAVFGACFSCVWPVFDRPFPYRLWNAIRTILAATKRILRRQVKMPTIFYWRKSRWTVMLVTEQERFYVGREPVGNKSGVLPDECRFTREKEAEPNILRCCRMWEKVCQL